MNINSEEFAPQQGAPSIITNILTSIYNQFNGFFNTQAASESFNRRPVVSIPRSSDFGDIIIKKEDTTEYMVIKTEANDCHVKIKTEEDVCHIKIKTEDDLDVKIKIEEEDYVKKEPTSVKRVVSPETSAESNQIDERLTRFTGTESRPSTSSNTTQAVVPSTTSRRRRRRRRPYRPITNEIYIRPSQFNPPVEPYEFRFSTNHRPANYVPYPYGPTSFEFQRVPRRVNDDTLNLIISFYNKH